MDNLIESFKSSIFGENLEKIENILSTIEEPIDVLSEDPIIKAIPIVSKIVSLSRACLAINDRILIKKLTIFITSMNNGSVSDKKLQDYKNKLESNPKILNRDLEKILVLIEKEVEEDKVKILAQLYKSYINGNLDWDELIHSSEIVRNLFLIDLIQLKPLYSEKEIKRNDGYYPFSMSRLNSLGLVEYYNGLLVNSQDNPGTQIIGKINELGEDFFKYAILDSGIELHEE